MFLMAIALLSGIYLVSDNPVKIKQHYIHSMGWKKQGTSLVLIIANSIALSMDMDRSTYFWHLPGMGGSLRKTWLEEHPVLCIFHLQV